MTVKNECILLNRGVTAINMSDKYRIIVQSDEDFAVDDIDDNDFQAVSDYWQLSSGERALVDSLMISDGINMIQSIATVKKWWIKL
jgi:tRNA uridine 5-carbamoylmethylation protein Kti12